MDVRVTGADQLAAVGKRLKETGNKTLKNELARGLRGVTKPLIADVRSAALRILPARGGLAARVAVSKIGARTNMTGPNVGVRIVAKSGYDLGQIDAGKLRHPVFGREGRWVTQDVPPGWWSETLAADEAKVRREVVAVVERVARKTAP